MIHELREYTAVPGRRPDLVTRFRDHTFELFAEHGMEVTFFGLTGDDEIVHGLAFASPADLDAKWAGSKADHAWREVKRASEVDGPIVAAIRSRVLEPLT